MRAFEADNSKQPQRRCTLPRMKKTAAQLNADIAEALGSVGVKKLFAWAPKLEETIVDVHEGRISHSPTLPLRVSRLRSPRGAYFIIDGHHRAVEAILAGKSEIAAEVDQHVPRIERAGDAYRNFVDNKVNLYDVLRKRAPR
jgi:hypothetical protein